MDVGHLCDNKLCVNPAHLKLQTRGENVRQQREHGRRPLGEMVTNSKLTSRDVIFARNSTLPQRILGNLLGVNPNTIGKVRRREIWSHIS